MMIGSINRYYLKKANTLACAFDTAWLATPDIVAELMTEEAAAPAPVDDGSDNALFVSSSCIRRQIDW